MDPTLLFCSVQHQIILLCLTQIILLCLTPDDFTRQGESAGA
jgi:hypothetical protein